jgi:hypothetical protein
MSGPTYYEQLRRIVVLYREASQPWPATTSDLASWAIREGHWKPHPHDLVRQLAEHFAGAMREEYITDPQGRTVRAKHAARVKRGKEQLVLWADIRTATPEHMEIAFQQRRHQIVGDCRQLKTDVDSYNQNANPPKQIRMIFDFTDDLAEFEAMERMAD